MEKGAGPTRSASSDALSPTKENKLLFQAFEWHTPSNSPIPNSAHPRESHWNRLSRLLPELVALGVTAAWIPPGCKANSPQSNGYDCHDLWDLGEFDQKWTRSTKWGSREELQDLLETAKGCGNEGVDIIWDAVLNHKTAGDATEETWAVEVDAADRRVEISAPKQIKAWLKYDFPGREREGMKYSALKWRAEHFNGTDWDDRAQKNAIYKLIDDPATYPKPSQSKPHGSFKSSPFSARLARLVDRFSGILRPRNALPIRPGKGWQEDVDKTNGNNDWLMFSNVYYKHPDVSADTLHWGQWIIQDTGVHGFRLDAAQHISTNFMREWIAHAAMASKKTHGKDPFIVGEVLAAEVSRQVSWLDTVTPSGSPVTACAFDIPLLYSFSRVSEDVRKGSKRADLRTLLAGPGDPEHKALVAVRPAQAVTFVTNHDTQTGQASFVPMDSKIKALFYAFILLRKEGHPCVFWGDLYGIHGDENNPPESPAGQIPDKRPAASNDGYSNKTTSATPVRSVIPSLMLARKLLAYGEQVDYFQDMACIAWTRAGTHDRPGCAVIISIRPSGQSAVKRMAVGNPGETWVNILQPQEDRTAVIIDEQGSGAFSCIGMSVGVFVKESGQYTSPFPVDFDHNVYR